MSGVREAYGRRVVLRDADLVGVVSENGAGKSTLLRIAVGQMAADAGRVERFGARAGVSATFLYENAGAAPSSATG
ncbi:ATP-binding cassette domain-containing protein [Streptomyces sp. NPDC048251]|uniref:ATP-binding cassette domain-containing protein n=1 Tax=Streptomyces sp. NPDC048251 TaxID=3154501 RepID=UPI0034238CB2